MYGVIDGVIDHPCRHGTSSPVVAIARTTGGKYWLQISRFLKDPSTQLHLHANVIPAELSAHISLPNSLNAKIQIGAIHPDYSGPQFNMVDFYMELGADFSPSTLTHLIQPLRLHLRHTLHPHLHPPAH